MKTAKFRKSTVSDSYLLVEITGDSKVETTSFSLRLGAYIDESSLDSLVEELDCQEWKIKVVAN